jgi:hypothetical protein
MKTRTAGGAEKEQAIRERYRQKERAKYGGVEKGNLDGDVGRSSEDVWKSREKKMEWGEAFNKPFPRFEGSDEEWNIIERERRRR